MRVLQYVEAEEVVSRDLLVAFSAVYDSRVIDRVARDERRHARTLERILGEGSLQRSTSQGSAGVLSGYAGLLDQYWQWLAWGLRDLRSAAEASLAAERQHLAVLDATIAALANRGVRRELMRIRHEDREHLRVLERLRDRTPSVRPCLRGRC